MLAGTRAIVKPGVGAGCPRLTPPGARPTFRPSPTRSPFLSHRRLIAPAGAAKRRARVALVGLLVIVPLGWPGGLSAQAAADNSRDALALAYLQLDYLLRDTPLPPETRSGFNRAFDGATLLFFGGRFDQARNRIDSLATVLVPQRLARDAAAAEATAVLARLPAEQLQLPGTNGAPIPYHLYVPPDAAGRAVPLLVVLHGAGGQEQGAGNECDHAADPENPKPRGENLRNHEADTEHDEASKSDGWGALDQLKLDES